MTKKKHRIRHEKSLWAEFRVEIFIGFIFILGVFLLVEEMEIKQTFFYWIGWSLRVTANGVYAFSRSIRDIIMHVENSDLVGIALIVTAIILISLRFRKKVIQRYSSIYSCPECEGELRRVHRTKFQTFLEFFMLAKIKNYQCKQCSYTGIQITER